MIMNYKTQVIYKSEFSQNYELKYSIINTVRDHQNYSEAAFKHPTNLLG